MWLSLLLVLVPAPRFLAWFSGFPPSTTKKTTFLNSDSTCYVQQKITIQFEKEQASTVTALTDKKCGSLKENAEDVSFSLSLSFGDNLIPD